MKKKVLRILHTPTTIGNFGGEASVVEKRLGYNSCCVIFKNNKYNFRYDEALFSEGDGALTQELKRLLFLIKAIFRFDIIFYNFGSTIFRDCLNYVSRDNFFVRQVKKLLNVFYFYPMLMIDVKIFKLLGKKIIVIFQGDDARQKDFCIKNFEINSVSKADADYYPSNHELVKKKKIKIFDKYADSIYACNPDLLHVLPSRAIFIPYSHVNPKIFKECYSLPEGKIRVVHAPTHQGVKGTKEIEEAISVCIAGGLPIEYVRVENLSYNDALLYYQSAHLFIDQIFAGWYGGVAVEVMSFGVPVMAYIRESDLEFISKEMRDDLPIINVNQKTLIEEITKFLKLSSIELSDLSKRSRSYVEKWHNGPKILETIAIENYGKPTL